MPANFRPKHVDRMVIRTPQSFRSRTVGRKNRTAGTGCFRHVQHDDERTRLAICLDAGVLHDEKMDSSASRGASDPDDRAHSLTAPVSRHVVSDEKRNSTATGSEPSSAPAISDTKVDVASTSSVTHRRHVLTSRTKTNVSAEMNRPRQRERKSRRNEARHRQRQEIWKDLQPRRPVDRHILESTEST